MVLYTTRLLYGKSGAIYDARGVIDGSRLMAVESHSKVKPTNKLGRLTLLPGRIDAHVHIAWHFDRKGGSQDEADKEEAQPSRRSMRPRTRR